MNNQEFPKRALRRWVVTKEYYRDSNEPLFDEYPIAYGSEGEAKAKMMQLNRGADPSFFVHNDDSMPVLYVQMIYL